MVGLGLGLRFGLGLDAGDPMDSGMGRGEMRGKFSNGEEHSMEESLNSVRKSVCTGVWQSERPHNSS